MLIKFSLNVQSEFSDAYIAEELLRLRKADIEEELGNIYRLKNSKGDSAAVFNVRDKILGRKKDADEPAVIKDPKTGELVFQPSDILKASVEYCENFLKNRDPRDGFEEDLNESLKSI